MAAVVSLTPTPVQRFYDNNNNPLVGGKLYTYAAGTTNPINSYTDSTGATPNTNPVIMNARGECQVWLSEGTAYKLVLEDSAGNVIWTVDGIIAAAGQEIFYQSNMIPMTDVGTIIVTGIGVMEWSAALGAYVPENPQQQVLSASVLSNALTLAFDPQGPLTFRNPTITNGSPLILPMPSAQLSITIPSGATLGTTSGVNATLVVAVAYNGGSPVLMVANPTPGMDLSETALVSPTTISAGATSAGIWYSASAVGAGSPYRILGFVVVNEVAAGTWATTPSEIQGTGGLAFLDMLQATQIQTVGASVASNALTATYTPAAAPFSLQFRNPTLTNGAPVNASPGGVLSITVPSGATLGTANGQPSLLALLVAYNAGSPVLCVTNLAGGADLSETGLISPTTISSGATSAGVIYSASAVAANSPYRVVGVIAMPGQTTAGTWATGPTNVQGIGGMAYAALQSFGYGQTRKNLTASRSGGTTYYNTTSRPIFLSITGSAGNPTSNLNLVVNGATFQDPDVSGTSVTSVVFVCTPILPGESYSVTGGGIVYWFEVS